MKALKIIGIIIVAVIVIFVLVSSLQPSQGHIEKSITINASPATIYKEINSFKSFNQWSPWMKMDPGVKTTLEGPESGVGAKMSWDGEKTGKGSQWIEESVENQRVKNALAFEGYDGKAYAEFKLEPDGSGTKVTWTYDGTNDGIMDKAMWMFMSGMLSGQYEEGLADLKKYAESLPPVTSDSTTVVN